MRTGSGDSIDIVLEKEGRCSPVEDSVLSLRDMEGAQMSHSWKPHVVHVTIICRVRWQ